MAYQQHIRADFTYGEVEILRDEELGVGAYGAVYRARCDELVCAAKVLHPILFDDDQGGGQERLVRQFNQECFFLRDLRHPNIVQYLGTRFEGNERVLLMELLDDNLTHYLEQRVRNPLPYHREIDICYDVALALAYLHSNFVIHRDLSGKNVLLLGERRAKVSDFGVSKLIHPHRQRQSSWTFCPGNSRYMPPEAIDESHGMPYSEKLDCFSYGVLCVQIFTRQFPNPTSRFIMAERANLRNVVSEIERRQAHISMIDHFHPFLQTILDCLHDSAEERPSAQELCHRLVGLKEGQRYTESIRENDIRPTAQGRGDDEERQRDEHVRTLEEQVRELRAERDELQSQMRNTRVEITRKNREIEEKNRTIAQFERERLQLRREAEELAGHVEEIQAQLHRSEQQFRADMMGLEQSIHERESTISELNRLNDELRAELERREQVVNRRRALSDRISRLRITSQYSGEAPRQMRREPDAVVGEGTIYFKYFWGKHIISYDISGGNWHELPDCPNSSFSMATIDGYLTIIGGKKPNLDPTNSLLTFRSGGWVEDYPPMPTKRYWTIATRHDTHVIVIGGEGEGRTPLCTVEVFETVSRQWYSACRLPHPFDSATASVISGQLFLAGGSSENTAKCVLSCSVTHLLECCCHDAAPGDGSATRQSGVWSRVCDLPFYKMTITNFGDHYLIAVGGKEGNAGPSSAIFVYDTLSDNWTKIGHLRTARTSCFAVPLPRGGVMVVGGLVDGEGRNTATSVELLEVT